MVRVSLLACLSLSGCFFSVSDDNPSSETPRAVTPHHDGEGTVIGAYSDGSVPLFSFSATESLQSALEAHLVDADGAFGLPRDAVLSLRELGSTAAGDASLVTFQQDYHGHAVDGPGARITVLHDGSGVYAVVGRPVDQNNSATGLSDGIREEDAQAYISRAWLAESADASAVDLSDLELIFVPSKGTMGWKASVKDDGGGVGTVIIDAVDGGDLLVRSDLHYSLWDGVPISVDTLEHSDSPQTNTSVDHLNLPGSTWGSCDPEEDDSSCHVRMGDERLSVYDWYFDNTRVPEVSNPLMYDPWTEELYSHFGAGNSSNPERLLFHRAVLGTDYIDGLIGGWDYGDSVISLPPHLQVFVNVESADAEQGPRCAKKSAGGFDEPAIGVFLGWQWDEEEPTLSDGYDLLEAYDPAAPVASVSVCDNSEGTLYHEMGHYVDTFASFGMMGSGVPSDGCVPDTSDEARPLGETVADMFTLTLMRSTYPDLPYDLSTLDLEVDCSLNHAFSTYGSVHGEGCVAAASFDDERPTQIEHGSCKTGEGYEQQAMLQAWWKMLHGRECDAEAPYTCSVIEDHSPDPMVTAFLGALGISNHHSYSSLYQIMELVLLLNGEDAEAARLVRIAELHDID